MVKTRVSSLLLAFAIFFISSFMLILSSVYSGYTPPFASGILAFCMFLFTVALGICGWRIRKYKTDKSIEIDPIKAIRLLAFAKTASFGGSCIAGFTLAQTVIFILYSESMFMQDMIIVSLISFLSCVALAVTGFVVENWCIIDDEDNINNGNSNKLSSGC